MTTEFFASKKNWKLLKKMPREIWNPFPTDGWRRFIPLQIPSFENPTEKVKVEGKKRMMNSNKKLREFMTACTIVKYKFIRIEFFFTLLGTKFCAEKFFKLLKHPFLRFFSDFPSFRLFFTRKFFLRFEIFSLKNPNVIM